MTAAVTEQASKFHLGLSAALIVPAAAAVDAEQSIDGSLAAQLYTDEAVCHAVGRLLQLGT